MADRKKKIGGWGGLGWGVVQAVFAKARKQIKKEMPFTPMIEYIYIYIYKKDNVVLKILCIRNPDEAVMRVMRIISGSSGLCRNLNSFPPRMQNSI